LVGIHFVLAISIFAVSLTAERRAGLPILVTIIDYPASILADWIIEIVPAIIGRETAMAIYLVIGSIWFYFIGVLLRTIIQKFIRRH